MEVMIGFAIGVALLAILLAATVILGYIGKMDFAVLTGTAVVIGIVPQLTPIALIAAIVLIVMGKVNFGITAIIGTIVGIGIVAGTLAMIGVDLATLSLTDNYWQIILDTVFPPAN